jgi:L-lactate dehydrogenase complex protein LldG
MEIEFGEQFSRLMGKFVYCASAEELKLQLHGLLLSNKWNKIVCREDELKKFLPPSDQPAYTDLENADAAVTSCEALVARTGSIILSSAGKSGRTTSVYAAVHICIAYTSQLVYDIKDGLQLIRERYAGKLPSLVTFATGPSRTADIEKTLVVGVHGPREVYVFLVERDVEN